VLNGETFSNIPRGSYLRVIFFTVWSTPVPNALTASSMSRPNLSNT